VICVYALVTPRGRLRLAGIAREPLRAVGVNGIAAVVGDIRRRPIASTKNLRRYAAVVESIAARVPAILPTRFGTTFDDSTELTMVLRSRAASIRERLRKVRGRAQMTISLVGSDPGDGSSRGQTPVTSRAGVRPRNKATQGTRYMQERLALLRQTREIHELAPLQSAIQRFVKDERVERRGSVATVHHLVPRGTADRYRAIVQRAAEENGFRLAVSGPWAPYAFADNW
jgi:hypothetical protein